jgi:predicted GNAT family N-acyltransferase
MNILIDTNIVIPLEDTERQLSPNLAEFRRICSALGHRIFVHPEQKADLLRDTNQNRRDIVISRIQQYEVIQSPPVLNDNILAELGWRQTNDNDRVDNSLLFAVKRGAVHCLVTNDNGIHRKAKQSGISDLCFRLDQFLAAESTRSSTHINPPFGISLKYLYEFNVNQAFFDSLRNGYDGFNDWYERSARNQRQAWCVTSDITREEIKAICIFKIERDQSIVTNGSVLQGKILKLCTFKVGENVRGRKLGERLLYTAFKYANENSCDWVYLHTFGPEQQMLVGLCLEYGFTLAGKYGRDEVYLKKMHPDSEPLNAIDYAIRFYPHFRSDLSVKKFLVPIQPVFHNQLFADISDISTTLFANDPTMYSAPANTIKKAYICYSKIKKIQSGDLLLFYRSRDRMSIEAVGIVELVQTMDDPIKVQAVVSKRTVYSEQQISEILRKPSLVILFRLQKYIHPIHYTTLLSAGLIGPYQSIREIDNTTFGKLHVN